MLRFYFVIFLNMFRYRRVTSKMQEMADHVEKYSEKIRYEYAQYVVGLMRKTGWIRTKGYGMDHLPKEGGYMMYPNHQGKYDVYGIITTHEKPCSFVMDIAKSYMPFVREALALLRGKRLDKVDVRQALTVINEVAEEVAQGARFILFPEGGYENNKNTLQEFKPGCFKITLKSHAPIVPVALIDSYKVFNSNCIGRVTTQVHYLAPIYYDEYRGMKTVEIADMVQERIEEKIKEVTLFRENR